MGLDEQGFSPTNAPVRMGLPALRTGRLPRILVAAALVVALTAACGGSTQVEDGSPSRKTGSAATSSLPPPEVTQIAYAAQRRDDFGWLFVGIDQGIFEKYGLDVSVSELKPPLIPAGLVNNSIQATALAGTCARAALKGVNVVDIGMAAVRGTDTVVAREGIDDVEDLSGKTIVTQSSTSTPTIKFKSAMKGLGVSGINYLSLPEQSAQIATFRAGEADAILEPAAEAAKLLTDVPGSKVILTSDELGPRAPYSGFCVAKSFLEQNPNTVRALGVAMLESVNFVTDNEEETVEVFQRRFELTAEQAEFTYNQLVPTLYYDVAPTDKLFANGAAYETAAGGKPVTGEEFKKTYDLTVAREIAEIAEAAE